MIILDPLPHGRDSSVSAHCPGKHAETEYRVVIQGTERIASQCLVTFPHIEYTLTQEYKFAGKLSRS